MDYSLEGLHLAMIQLLAIVLVVIILLVVGWIILEVYPAWKKLSIELRKTPCAN